MKVVATYSIKGGVGKTSAAVNLAALAAREGLRTVLWDLDPQGAATFLFRVEPKVKGGGSKLIRGQARAARRDEGHRRRGPRPAARRLLLPPPRHPARQAQEAAGGRVTACSRQLEDAYDLAILDCAPSISLVSESVFTAADLLLVPLVPSTLAVRTLDQLRDFLAGVPEPAPEVLPFFSMVDRRKRLHKELVADAPRRRRARRSRTPARSS